MIQQLVRALGLSALLTLAACAPYVELPGPQVRGAMMTDSFVYTYDGAALPLRSWLPDGEPKAVIVALHGFNDYSNSWEAPGRFWAKQGLATYAYDQRGFGKTDQRGLWHGGQVLAEDLKDVITLAHRRHPGKPLYVVGESMGGAVAMVAMAGPNPPPVDGMVLSAPAVWGRSTMNVFERAGLWFFSHTIPWFMVSGKGLDIKPSDNVDMLRALSKDPLVIKQTRIDAVHGLVDLMDAAQAAAADIKVPTLVLYGEKDEIVPPEATVKMISKLHDLGERQRVAVYPKGYHMLLRDLQAEVVLKDVATWVTNKQKPLPSGSEQRAAEMLARWDVAPHPGGSSQGALPTIAGPAAEPRGR
jgi:alpha-beta hydrolase superfamily lysophospholipase